MKLIILIGQRVRSGTNFLGSVISQHPEIQNVPLKFSHGEFNLFKSDLFQVAYNEVTKASFGMNFSLDDELSFIEGYGKLWINILVEKYNLDPEKPIFIKSPIIYYSDLWLKAFPNAKFIFLCRDGRDNVISSVRASNDSRNWHTLKHKIIKKINYFSGRSFISHSLDWKKTSIIYHGIMPNKNVIKVRYEDLISDRDEVENLLKFLQVNSSPSIVNTCFNAPIVGSSFGYKKGTVNKPNWEPIVNKEGFTFKSKWKKWSFFKKYVFKLLASKELNKLGYFET